MLITRSWMQNAPGLVAKLIARYEGVLLLNEAGVLSREARIEHASDPVLSRMAWFARHFYRFADAVVAVSEGVRDDLELLGVPASVPLLSIPNPVDSQRVRALSRVPFEAGALVSSKLAKPLFISVGRLSAQKDHRLLIDAFAEFRAQTGVGNLIIVGEGPLRQELEGRIRDLDLVEHVSLPGFLANPFPLMASADAFVLSSREEGFGLVLVEAMALGIPVVAGDCPGGVSEVLDGGKAGLLVRPHDAEALYEGMRTIIDDSSYRARVIRGGMERVGSFQPALIAERWLDLARSVSH